MQGALAFTAEYLYLTVSSVAQFTASTRIVITVAQGTPATQPLVTVADFSFAVTNLGMCALLTSDTYHI